MRDFHLSSATVGVTATTPGATAVAVGRLLVNHFIRTQETFDQTRFKLTVSSSKISATADHGGTAVAVGILMINYYLRKTGTACETRDDSSVSLDTAVSSSDISDTAQNGGTARADGIVILNCDIEGDDFPDHVFDPKHHRATIDEFVKKLITPPSPRL